ncbi:hypothetical protein RHMOL_Rhmol04G0313400 [Rhododendron molle]|uniref:Uncharacterized protein n=1 Tax=Rhododendron molle TaxID=49168 RepID=A0ACC0P6K3_RHOML|nr:hypothetical protein RHMOL_Rhmol04G0313400 [Rhododendron molle]
MTDSSMKRVKHTAFGPSACVTISSELYLFFVSAFCSTEGVAAGRSLVPGGHRGLINPLTNLWDWRGANTIAMVCSVTSIILCLTALAYAEREEGLDHLQSRTGSAFMLIFVSVFVVMLAFISAMFAVLAHSIAFAMFICVIACTSFIVYYFELKKFFSYILKLE